MRALAVALVLCLAASAAAQRPVAGVERGGATYVEARSLAVALGDVVTAAGDTLTWRGAEGVVTFFAGSAEALLQRPGDGGPSEWALAAPVARDPAAMDAAGGGWLLPLDAVQLLGVATVEGPDGPVLHAPNGEVLVVALPAPAPTAGDEFGPDWEPVTMGGAAGLRFFAGDQSAMLLDLDLLPLAYPEATAAVDAAAARAGSDHALLLVATAAAPRPLDTAFTFRQGGQELTVRAPYRVHVFRGDAERLGPGREVAAVVLLPSTFSLYRPLTVSWAGVEATVTLRH